MADGTTCATPAPRTWSSTAPRTTTGCRPARATTPSAATTATTGCEGGDGADNLIGGLGDDIITDLFGDDVLKGGDGDDAISSGQGFGGDLNQGGRGNDFIVGGNDITESFAGPGNDFVLGGDDIDTVFGDDGDDWIEGGSGSVQPAPGRQRRAVPGRPERAGHDVLDGDGGEQDYDSEGGDDIMLGGPGIQRDEGMLGFDWVTHKGDPQAGRTPTWSSSGCSRRAGDALRDRFDLVEALSGWDQRRRPAGRRPQRGRHRRAGRRADRQRPRAQRRRHRPHRRPAGRARARASRSFNAGNIILGGDGSDTIEGRGGDDLIDGDKWLNVHLSVRNDAGTPRSAPPTAWASSRPTCSPAPSTRATS